MKTQYDMILTHMNVAGHITQRDAYIEYDISSFPRRIADLRAKGFIIISESAVHPVDGKRYTRYKFGEGSARTMQELRLRKKELKQGAAGRKR